MHMSEGKFSLIQRSEYSRAPFAYAKGALEYWSTAASCARNKLGYLLEKRMLLDQ